MEHIEIDVDKETRMLEHQDDTSVLTVTVKIVSRNRERVAHHSFYPLRLSYDWEYSPMQFLLSAMQLAKAHSNIRRVLVAIKD